MKKHNFVFAIYWFLFIAFAVSYGCSDDSEEPPVVDAELVVSPGILSFNASDTGLLYLSVQPASKFTWQISSAPEWLNISPMSGTVKDEIIELQITAKAEGLGEGNHSGQIEIISNGAGHFRATVVMHVDPHPVAQVEPAKVDLGTENEKSIFINNSGTGILTWQLKDAPEWVSLSRTDGRSGEDYGTEVIVSAIRKGLPVGAKTGSMVLSSNSEEGDITIDLSMEVPALALISSSVSEITFAHSVINQSFYVRNEGNVDANWEWSMNETFLSADITEGTINPGDSAKVTLTLDRSQLTEEQYSTEATLSCNDGNTISLPIHITHYNEVELQIDGKIIDAEYDRINDVIIAVSEGPNELRKFDPVTQTISTVALNMIPKCVSVSQDGNYAAVGHDGQVAYVNLSTMTIEKHYGLTTNAYDIVLAPNNWVYVVPESSQWEKLRCINLATGVESNQTGYSIHGRTKIKLHPTGDYIYGANNGLSPSDFEKYDITGGTAAYLYDSPYHGDYDFSGDIWISEDGNRLFAKSRNVFNSSATQANDMTYNGALSGEGYVMTLDYSAAASKICAVFTEGSYWDQIPGNEVHIYETTYLAFQETMTLPAFLVPDGQGGVTKFESQGHFGFFNASGTAYYVLVKAEAGSGMINEWAITTIDID
ncbi:hypothetical protein KEM09_19440 [Carboxylicivirga mesophila]|uniref:BACON domain-containing protein n=1 Tax=Carboxylicivirga mesophila TaxID=1166478 RepID=A0ABS5KEW3_9BACT|nr:hypothetical protein [Carboxylicivirga mesophila]MBS2213591.1 hypothetical protein [Carboxylicivirga mesophila]